MADTKKLTPEQIENWRNAMLPVLGPYALIMSDEDVQRLRDDMQRQIDEENQ